MGVLFGIAKERENERVIERDRGTSTSSETITRAGGIVWDCRRERERECVCVRESDRERERDRGLP